MGNLLKTGSQFLESKRALHMTSEVTYWRGQDSVVVKATQGKTEYAAFDEDGAEVQAQVTDFLITTADLILGGGQVFPKYGDEITTDVGTYAVLHLGDDGCWRYSDPYGDTLRVHTKLVT